LLAARELFKILKEYPHLGVTVSFYEIYCGKAYDLLNNRTACPIRADAKENVNIVGLKETPVSDENTMMHIIEYGNKVRVTGQTGANDESSRSHAVLQVNLRDFSQKEKIMGK